MRAKELWRFAPQMHMRTERKSAPALPTELIPPELQAKMVAAFEGARAERLAEQIPEDGARWASDPSTRWNTAAFLVLERQRRVVAERLSQRYRRRGDRYRDLILVTRLIHLEYEHLAGRVNGGADLPSPSNGLPVNGDTPADWARPWGSGPMVEMGAALSFYQNQRDQLASRLSIPRRGIAAAAAAGRGERILNRFKMVKGGQLGPEPLSAPQSERRGAWRWAWPSFATGAAVVACAGVALGVGAILGESGGPTSRGSNPAPVVASVPDAVLDVDRQSGEQAPGNRGDGSKAPEPGHGKAADQVPVSAPAPAPEPAPEPTPAPAPTAPAPTPAPQPTPAPEPDPEPQDNSNSGPGPVSPLPPPVDPLPAPKGSGSG
jgi:hypothetical protein